MAVTGFILLEKTKRGSIISQYACATREIVLALKSAIEVEGLSYSLRQQEFTDAEFAETIGYLSSLDKKEQNRQVYIMTGENI